MSEQPQLFDPGPEDTGPLSVRQFMNQATWHGTTREGWGPHLGGEFPVHHGTSTAALDRHRHKDDAQYYPVVPSETSQMTPMGDNEANIAEERWSSISKAQQRGKTIDESHHRTRLLGAKPEIQEGVASLEQGRAVPYENMVEDPGSTSFVTRSKNLQTVDQTRDFHLLPESAQRKSLSRRELFQQGQATSRIRDFGVEDPPRQAPQMFRTQAGGRSAYIDPEVLE